MTENEYLFESIALKGQCPDCQQVKLDSNGPHVFCKACHAMFFAQEYVVRRVEPDQQMWPMMRSGDVLKWESK
jgi:hypothetical protein